MLISLRRWLKPQLQLHRLGSYRGVDAAAFSPDGRQLTSIGRDEVILWDTASGKEQYRLDSDHSVDATAFSPDGKQLALIGRDEVILWDTATGKRLYRLYSVLLNTIHFVTTPPPQIQPV